MSGSLRCCWLLILLLAAFVVGAPALRRNQRRVTVWPDVGEEAAASKKLVEAVRLRSKHVWRKPVAYSAPFPHGSVAVALSAASAPPVYDPLGALAKLPAPQWGAEPPRVVWDAGVARTAGGGALLSRLPPPTNWTVWSQDFERLRDIINDPPVRTFATSRLQDLGQLFDLYRQNNARKEYDAQVPAGGAPPGQRDYAHVAKVDTHVHVAAVMSQEQLLRFMKRKIRCCGGDVVGANTTLAQLFARLNLDADTLTLDVLDMFAHSTFERFDIFDKSYSPAGHAELRSLFLSASNEQQPVPGAYFAELVKETLAALTPNVHLELRVSVAGKSRSDWSKVAAWVLDNSLIHPQVRWLVQVPRNYKIYYEAMAAAAPPGQPFSFSYEAFLRNIFDPMWEATLHPEQHAALHKFLALVVGFDSVNDESRADAPTTPPPAALDAPVQPGYAYELFYFAANLASVNNAREALGLTTFSFRPHSGEAGDTEHLAAAFLTAESIGHGINLRKSAALQYLYYICQVGLALTPISNNRLFLRFPQHPFADFFRVGLAVSLGTDDPALFAVTGRALEEEYTTALHLWSLNFFDMCEIARNSVLLSGLEAPFKQYWAGRFFALGGVGNDQVRTNVPQPRISYRERRLRKERARIRLTDADLRPAHGLAAHEEPRISLAAEGIGAIRSGGSGGAAAQPAAQLPQAAAVAAERAAVAAQPQVRARAQPRHAAKVPARTVAASISEGDAKAPAGAVDEDARAISRDAIDALAA